MPGEHAVLDFGNHRLLVTDDSRQDLLLGAQAVKQILAHLHPHRHRLVARALEFAQCPDLQQLFIHCETRRVDCLILGYFSADVFENRPQLRKTVIQTL